MAYSITGYDQTLILDFLRNDPSWATAKPWFRPENYLNVECGALSNPECLARLSSLTPNSRLYIVGHGDKNEPYLMTDKRELIHFTKLADILGSVLTNPDLKINDGTGNLYPSRMKMRKSSCDEGSFMIKYTDGKEVIIRRAA